MVRFVFTKQTQKKFLKLPELIQIRFTEKLEELKIHPDLKSLLKPLKDFQPPAYRLRIGSYRLILHPQTGENFLEYMVVDIGHRRDIYH